MRRIAPVLLIPSFLVACQESEPTRPAELGPVSFGIEEGANGEFFFLPPLVKNPRRLETYGDSPFNPDLAPYVRICRLDEFDEQCDDGYLEPHLPMELQLWEEKYIAVWRTIEYAVELGQRLRIEVMVGDERLGYRDVEITRRAKNCGNERFCKVVKDSAVPVQVHIEALALCPTADVCQTKSFNLQDGASFEIHYDETDETKRILLDIPAQSLDELVTLDFALCDASEVAHVYGLIDLPTFGPCASTAILTDWDGVLDPNATATVSFCGLDDPNFGLGPDQGAHLRVHAFHEDDTVESLREKNYCFEGLVGAPTNPLRRFASGVRDRVSSWFGVRPLLASAAVSPGARGGNSVHTMRTEFVITLDGKIDYLVPDDEMRTAPPGDQLSTTAVVTDLAGGGVEGARVRWKVVEPSEEDPYLVVGQVSSVACTEQADELVCETDGDGEVTVTWTLADDPGENRLMARGRGIADPREAFNGPRGKTEVEYDYGSLDPFTPIAAEESEEDEIVYEDDEGAETIVEGTRLLFGAAGALVGNLVSWWPGDEHARDIVDDNDGTLINYDPGDTRFAPGIDDYAFAFDGTGRGTGGSGTGQEVNGPANGMESLTGMTVEAWVKHNTLPEGVIERYVTIAGGYGPIGVIRHDGATALRQFHYYMRVGGAHHEVRVDNILQTGCFHHAVGTYDGTVMIAYLDGMEVGRHSVSGSINPAGFVALSSADEPLDGLIDDVRIYDRALTPTEIETLYDAVDSDKCDPLPSQQIAFTRYDGENWEIYVMDGDGSNQTRLTFDDAEDRNPAWSPDGYLALERGADADAEIFVTRDEGATLENLTDNESFDGYPAWSPDGEKIAFSSRRDGGYYEIWVMDADGGNPTQLTNTDTPGGNMRPAWSPDGTKIAFDSGRHGAFEIYVMDANGDNQTRLTNNSVSDFKPSWSPDGNMIAFERDDGNFDIFVMDKDGSNQTRVTQHAAYDADPAWTPDGLRIAFASNRFGSYDIFLVRPDGSNLVRLTTWQRTDREPAWSWDQ